jgi:hypothetical protein
MSLLVEWYFSLNPRIRFREPSRSVFNSFLSRHRICSTQPWQGRAVGKMTSTQARRPGTYDKPTPGTTNGNRSSCFTRKGPRVGHLVSSEGTRQRPLLLSAYRRVLPPRHDGRRSYPVGKMKWPSRRSDLIFDNRSKRAQPLNLQRRVSDVPGSDEHFDNGNGLAGLQPASGMALPIS